MKSKIEILLEHKPEYYQYLSEEQRIHHKDLVRGTMIAFLPEIYWDANLILRCLKEDGNVINLIEGKVLPEFYHECCKVWLGLVSRFGESVAFFTGDPQYLMEAINKSPDCFRFITNPTYEMVKLAAKRGVSAQYLKNYAGIPEMCSLCPQLLEDDEYVPGYTWLAEECEAGRTDCLKYCGEVFPELIVKYRPDLYERLNSETKYLIQIADLGVFISAVHIQAHDYYKVCKHLIKFWPDRFYRIDPEIPESGEFLMALIEVNPASVIRYESSLTTKHIQRIIDLEPRLLKCLSEVSPGVQRYALKKDLDNVKYIKNLDDKVAKDFFIE